MANKSARLWPLRHKLFSVFILIVLVVAGFFVYQRITLELNKRGFQQARSAIDIVYADIIAKVGPPDNSKRVNSCNRVKEEFENGPLSCDVDTSFIYGVNGVEEADSLMSNIQNLIANHPGLLQPSAPLTNQISSTLVVNSYYQTAHDHYKTARHMKCETSYIYDTLRETDLSIKDQTKKPLEIGIDCSDWAKAQYYPLN